MDIARAAKWKERFADVRLYQDWRQLLEKEKHLDSVNVSTPDHMHAPIAMTAIQLGKHVYCQKPLAHDIFEARRLKALAAQYKVASQMGNQGHAGEGVRRLMEWIASGVIGTVREA
ncbi:MAG: Gfo/Idh/MocA family oxidoreductase, partial [Kiritimatiellaeota bacterium]|nr:Gfo/Idh/MocA family oxidoreductase [Kiritimatiellota bacterium]